ncbi:MAG: Ldh family oxidoreductase [Thermoplasmata archaeon]|nr:Ldh family oxidoreductase [Thermoplasmata archaeon]
MFEKVEVDESYIRIPKDRLEEFYINVLTALSVQKEDARIVADNLIIADLRGIESHGAQRFGRYVRAIKKGTVNLKPDIKIEKESQVHALLDGDEGLGQPVSYKAMMLAIEKAKENFIGMVGVRNSNHFGIAGHYSLLAVDRDMIGISMTTTRPLVVPTWGLERAVGTNPIAIGIPVKDKPPFLLDMATSVVATGKFELYKRKNKPIPEGWGLDGRGEITTDPNKVLSEGAELPLGGLGELLGGHKGYGLSLAIDALCGVLTNATWSKWVKNTDEKRSNVGHMFIAINIDAFTPVEDFKERMKRMIEDVKRSKAMKGKKIWYPGEKGAFTAETRLKIGIPVYHKVVEELNGFAREVGVERLV